MLPFDIKISITAVLVGLLVPSTKAILPTIQFVPLSCNDNVESVVCDSWSDRFGVRTTFTDPVIVPCGECILIDHTMSGATLTFDDGIDVRGKLVVLDGVTIKIVTPMITVQGELQMYATKKAVDGNPYIHILLVGQNERQGFTAIDENSNKCNDNGTALCEIGKKAIAIVGGKLTVQGLPPNTPAWVTLHDVGYLEGETKERPSFIVIKDSIRGKWDVGAEILITSHTRVWNGHQVRKIKSISRYSGGNGFVQVELDSPIIRPTTFLQSSHYAVEVALLSRNILFEGGPDSIENHGGQFNVLNTPLVKQTLIGVDFQNFGQQGYLGRYPIHIHFNGDMTGSVVAKNTVRQSNQRCIVVHGTNGILVEDNVAFDTKGHCFIVEDGIETRNIFKGNLGAQTGIPKRNIPDMGPNSRITDDKPSTFWITNPTNTWIGNVAAGSQDSGFWFELHLRGTEANRFSHLDPNSDPVILFKDNVAHSNQMRGFQTYPDGYNPNVPQGFYGLKSYRNGGQGIFLHLTKNIVIENALVADNVFVGIDIDRAEGITVKDSKVIGLSRSYLDFIVAQDAQDACSMDRSYGIDLHTWKQAPENNNVLIEDVSFEGFNSCLKSFPFHVDADLRTEQFNAYSALRDITFQNLTTPVTLCDAKERGIDDVYITDLDGSLFRPPSGRSVRTPAAIVSDSATMTTFVNNNRCTISTRGCYRYCESTCIRSFRFEIDPANTENYNLRVCSRSNPSLCISTKGYQKYSELKDFIVGDNRVFLAHVPVGLYDATFLNQNGEGTWPSFVLSKQEELTCTTRFPGNAMNVVIPTPGPNDCKQLVRNGDLEADDAYAKFWLFRNGGIELVSSRGIGNSNAMAPIERTARASLIQYIDSRCLSVRRGRVYRLSAMIKLESGNGGAFFCDSTKKNCPEIGYRSSGNGMYRKLANVDSLSSTDNDGYYPVTTYFEINESMAASEQTLIYIQSNVAGKRMLVDDISIRFVEDESILCRNIIVMPEVLPTKNWRVVESGILDVIDGPISSSNKQLSMRFKSRRDDNDSIAYSNWDSLIVSKCFTPRSKWRITAQLQLVRRGIPISCDLSSEDCPALRFLLFDDDEKEFFNVKESTYVNNNWISNEFNVAQMTITLPSTSSQWDGTIGRVLFQIGSFPSNYDLIVGAVQISPM